MNRVLYWLWLQRVLGYGAWIADAVRFFGGAQKLYEATENDYRVSQVFGKASRISPSRLKLLIDKNLAREKAIAADCEKRGVQILTPEDALYPKSLLLLADYPAALFVKGDISCLQNRLVIAVVGSRHPSDYAQRAASMMTSALVSQGALIVSGGALGVDSVAHKTALDAESQTVLVMGCGFDCGYLAENAPMRESVARSGALVSEYPPQMKPSQGSFPKRNRIISGLSAGLLIVEAGAHSGSLNIASHAKVQNRPLFVIPGDVSSASFAGSNQLIREGAKPVFSVDDILSYFDMLFAMQNPPPSAQEPFQGLDTGDAAKRTASAPGKKTAGSAAALSCEAAPKETQQPMLPRTLAAEELKTVASRSAVKVYEIIIDGKNQMDEIVLSAALPTAKVLSALTELELLGVIAKGEGNYYTVQEAGILLSDR